MYSTSEQIVGNKNISMDMGHRRLFLSFSFKSAHVRVECIGVPDCVPFFLIHSLAQNFLATNHLLENLLRDYNIAAT